MTDSRHGIADDELELAAAALRGQIEVDSRDIADPALREIVAHAHEIDHEDGEVSGTEIVQRMRADGTLERLRSAGGLDLVIGLIERRPCWPALRGCAERVREAAQRRRIALRALELHHAAREGRDFDDVLSALEVLK